MFNLKNSNSYIYRFTSLVVLPLSFVLLLISLAFNNTLENTSDVLKIVGIAMQMFFLIVLGIKELIIKQNRLLSSLYFAAVIGVIIFVAYINII